MLHDLEELVLKCRDERARAYIGEAVGCYRATSYRAAIVATWIAVAFDIIDKMRELALSGDKEAARLTAEFELIRKSHDLAKSLTFERNLLQVARDHFELISPLEYQDLERIQQDRNRCAHPSLTSDSEVFSPSAELARVHIRSAVEILLMHEPAQGRAALEGLIKEIASPYFPSAEKDALKILERSSLKRARQSLARNFILVLLKTLLAPSLDDDWKQSSRYRAAFQCAKVLQPDVWRRTLGADLTRLFVPLSKDDELMRGCRVLLIDPELWTFLDEGQRTRISAFVSSLPAIDFDSIEQFLEYGPLVKAAETRVSRLRVADFKWAFFMALPMSVSERLASLYGASTSFDEANTLGKIVQEYASSFSKAQIEQIIVAASINDQITGSFQLRPVVQMLRKTKKYSDAEFNGLLAANNLNEYVV